MKLVSRENHERKGTHGLKARGWNLSKKGNFWSVLHQLRPQSTAHRTGAMKQWTRLKKQCPVQLWDPKLGRSDPIGCGLRSGEASVMDEASESVRGE
jgi:hypothetical protein